MPVGFKWFAPGLFDSSICFGGEESAGASFLRRDGTAWTTDKDGPIMDLLAAEITAVTGKDPGEHYRDLTAEFGTPVVHAPGRAGDAGTEGSPRQALPEDVQASETGRRSDHAKLTPPGNGAAIGGLKVVTAHGWFAARPSGTEDIYKIYAESFQGADHLRLILEEAQSMVSEALAAAPQSQGSHSIKSKGNA